MRGDQLVPLGVEAGPPINNAGSLLAVAAKHAGRAEALLLGQGGAAVDGDAGHAVAVGEGVAVVLVLTPVAKVGPVAVAVAPAGRPVAGTFCCRGQRVVCLLKEREASQFMYASGKWDFKP